MLSVFPVVYIVSDLILSYLQWLLMVSPIACHQRKGFPHVIPDLGVGHGLRQCFHIPRIVRKVTCLITSDQCTDTSLLQR